VHTHARASSGAKAWEPMASSSAKFYRKTRTAPSNYIARQSLGLVTESKNEAPHHPSTTCHGSSQGWARDFGDRIHGAERIAPAFNYMQPVAKFWVVVIGSPSVFGRNLQCELVRKGNTREECHWSHACASLKRAGVGTNGILEWKFLSENAHRTLGSQFALALLRRSCLHQKPPTTARRPCYQPPSVFGRNLQCGPVRKSGPPRGMASVTRLIASSEQQA
jgi:hypothetical protein